MVTQLRRAKSWSRTQPCLLQSPCRSLFFFFFLLFFLPLRLRGDVAAGPVGIFSEEVRGRLGERAGGGDVGKKEKLSRRRTGRRGARCPSFPRVTVIAGQKRPCGYFGWGGPGRRGRVQRARARPRGQPGSTGELSSMLCVIPLTPFPNVFFIIQLFLLRGCFFYFFIFIF